MYTAEDRYFELCVECLNPVIVRELKPNHQLKRQRYGEGY